jgi:hypothetical protein
MSSMRQHHASGQGDCSCLPALDLELMAHFGPAPIRVSARFVVLPSLILNYAGEAAVARRPSVISAASKLIKHPRSTSAKLAIGRQVGRDVELWRGLPVCAQLSMFVWS